ncbi:MAG: hypothetical protein PHN88_07680 [Ignavibacteria bacterium]|nr:hypothetical protein [Ignavibacteria bacterium]
MKEECIEYLRKVNKTDPIIKHIIEIHDEYCKILEDEIIVDVFVCEDFNKDNQKEDTSLIFFTSKGGLLEAKNYILNDRDIDYVKYLDKVDYYQIQYRNYDLEYITDSSWMKVLVKLSNGIRIYLYAIGKNCEYLTCLLKKYFVPLIK